MEVSITGNGASQVYSGRQVTGHFLKWLAIVTMAIDHVGAGIVEYALQYGSVNNSDSLYNFDMVLRSIGRLAFPLFIFLLAEGFHYTHSRKSYLIRLGIFSLVSDIPFDLALCLPDSEIRQGHLFSPANQNVFFTLFFGFLCMYLLDEVIHYYAESKLGLCILLCAVICAGGCAAGWFFSTDYDAAGVAAIIAAYFVRKTGSPVWEMLSIVLILGIFSSPIEFIALADVALVSFYHGKEGKKGSRWFFYFFYPCHLMVIFCIRFFFLPF